MAQEQFKVKNVKCNGCVNSIKNGLKDVPGVVDVGVDIAAGAVHVHGDHLARADIAAKLQKLGYPEA